MSFVNLKFFLLNTNTMDFLSHSFIGDDFIQYKHNIDPNERIRFSDKVRKDGVGNIPIVIDTIDDEIKYFLHDVNGTRGKEFVFHMDYTLNDVIEFLRERSEHTKEQSVVKNLQRIKLTLGLENGVIPSPSQNLGELYKIHRDSNDKILYLILTKEPTMYDYILSIFRYVKNKIYS